MYVNQSFKLSLYVCMYTSWKLQCWVCIVSFCKFILLVNSGGKMYWFMDVNSWTTAKSCKYFYLPKLHTTWHLCAIRYTTSNNCRSYIIFKCSIININKSICNSCTYNKWYTLIEQSTIYSTGILVLYYSNRVVRYLQWAVISFHKLMTFNFKKWCKLVWRNSELTIDM